MRKTIIITLLILLSVLFSFSQQTTAEEKENVKTNVMYVDHSSDQLEKTFYTKAEMEAAKRKYQKQLARQQKKNQQKDKLKRISKSSGSATILSVNISPQTSTFKAQENVFDWFTLLGEVKNTGSSSCVFPEITVDLYDAGDNYLGSASAYINGGTNADLGGGTFTNALYPGETGFFEATSTVDYSDVDHYEYSFDWDTYGHSPANADISFDGTPTTSSNVFDRLRIRGTVENANNYYVTYFTEVYFAIYNASGKVISVDSTYVDGPDYNSYHSAIYPGTSENFECNTQADFSKYSSYKYAFEWDEEQIAEPPTYTLTVQSSPGTGAYITISPYDNNIYASGYTNFTRTYDEDTVVTLTAPSTLNGGDFEKWTIDGADNTSRTINVTMDSNHTVVATYSVPTVTTYTLTVQSSGASNVSITVSRTDNDGKKNGSTNFTRTYDEGTSVSLTAPATSGGKYFSKWTVDGTDSTSNTVSVTMDKDITAVATYTGNPPQIALNRNTLYFTYVLGGAMPASQTVIVTNSGGGTLYWAFEENYGAISCSPGSGTNGAIVTVSMDPAGYAAGLYMGTVNVTSTSAINSPQYLDVYLNVINASANQAPFGDFATPLDGSTVSSSVAVTGWVVDDSGVNNVKIYFKNGNALSYIGDAVFVDGARTDIEAAYPTYPGSYKAGWGYMLLTNFLPNGDSTYELHAIATDSEGLTTTLGTKTITVDNATAVKPFGAIDAPGQGGTASGSNFANVGWVLTPMPNSIPTDGSTINVYVDGVNLGHPTYNLYRQDIATFFPGYANSNGSMARFYLDTTGYDTGVHTIFWTAADNAGNIDGIGSRFFTIENSGGSRTGTSRSNQDERLKPVNGTPTQTGSTNDSISHIPADQSTPIQISKGFDKAAPRMILPDGNGISHIRIKENERVEIDLSHLMNSGSHITGYMVEGVQLNALPLGSTLDSKNGKFCWVPVAGFMGDYNLTFIVQSPTGTLRKDIRVTILPEFDKE